MKLTRQDTINDALERLFDLGFTMEPGFSEHGPMVAEALSTLGRNDDVAEWVDAYKAKWRHLPAPRRQEPINGKSEDQWRNALGVYARTTDWLEFFQRELNEKHWQDILRTWVPVLLAGYSGGLTHGLIRTAHAVRSFPDDGGPTSLELDEFARGLAYWAGTYRTVPGNPNLHGELALDEALRRLPRRARDGDAEAPNSSDFTNIIESLRSVSDAEDAISRHTATFARVLLAHAELRPVPLIQLVHTITAPTAMRNFLPYFPREFGTWAYGSLWQVSAAIVARVAGRLKSGSETDPKIGEPALEPDDLIARAIEHRDEHVIKLTEACLREDKLRPDPVYRAAAEAVRHRLRRWS